jgi:hypothetical protein
MFDNKVNTELSQVAPVWPYSQTLNNPGRNPQTYFALASLMNKKCFLTLTPVVNVTKLFLFCHQFLLMDFCNNIEC